MSEDALKGGAGNENFSKAFSEILSNPEMMSAISSMAQKLKSDSPPQESESDQKTTANNDSAKKETEAISLAGKFPEILGLLSNNAGIEKNRRSDLLCALKPYLSQNRANAIDQIIKLSELSSVFKTLS